MERVIENFLRSAVIDTEKSEESAATDSKATQHNLAKVVAAQLAEMGAEEITNDEDH